MSKYMAKRKISVKGEDKRARILGKALQLFNKQGVEQVAVWDIARAPGVRRWDSTSCFRDQGSSVLERCHVLA